MYQQRPHAARPRLLNLHTHTRRRTHARRRTLADALTHADALTQTHTRRHTLTQTHSRRRTHADALTQTHADTHTHADTQTHSRRHTLSLTPVCGGAGLCPGTALMVCRYTGTVGITGGCCPPDERRTCSEMICFILDTASDKHKSVRFRFTPSQHERAARIITNVTLSSVKSVCGV